jgi:hypothetical protein
MITFDLKQNIAIPFNLIFQSIISRKDTTIFINKNS